MNRRGFLKAAAGGAAGSMVAGETLAEAGPAGGPALLLAAPCGLYCGICGDNLVNKECHGCGCACGKCAGKARREGCGIARCAARRKLESCADCPDLACTRLIQFACDPIWRTHAPVIENLRRRKAVGTPTWLREQAEYWAEPKAREAWLALYADCERKWRPGVKR